MPTLHELFAASIDERALRYSVNGPGARPETLRRIRTVRRRHSIAAGTTSAFALTSGFLVAAQGGGGLTTPANDAADVGGEVVIDLSNLSPFPSLPGVTPDAACGVSIADLGGTQTADGFAIETKWLQEDVLDSNGGYAQVRTAVTYNGEPRPPAFVDTGYAVITSEGTVVALVESDWQPRFERLDSGSGWVEYITLQGGAGTSLRTCDGEALRAGDYEVYVIAQASINEELLARQLLAEEGVVLAAQDGEEWMPGSEACEREARYPTTGERVLQCQPDLSPKVTLDFDKGTATVVYSPDLYRGSIDVQLISQPLALTIGGAVEAPGAGSDVEDGVGSLTGEIPSETFGVECALTQARDAAQASVDKEGNTIRYDTESSTCDGRVVITMDPDGRTVSVIEVE